MIREYNQTAHGLMSEVVLIASGIN